MTVAFKYDATSLEGRITGLSALTASRFFSMCVEANNFAVEPIQAAFRGLAPTGPGQAVWQHNDGSISTRIRYRDTFRIKTRPRGDGFVGAFSVLGPGSRLAPHSFWIEFGTAQRFRMRPEHDIVKNGRRSREYRPGHGIGGKFAWVMQGFVTLMQLRTGRMQAQHVVERATDASTGDIQLRWNSKMLELFQQALGV